MLYQLGFFTDGVWKKITRSNHFTLADLVDERINFAFPKCQNLSYLLNWKILLKNSCKIGTFFGTQSWKIARPWYVGTLPRWHVKMRSWHVGRYTTLSRMSRELASSRSTVQPFRFTKRKIINPISWVVVSNSFKLNLFWGVTWRKFFACTKHKPRVNLWFIEKEKLHSHKK